MISGLRHFVLTATIVLSAGVSWAWEPIAPKLPTRWSKEATPENALPEHPRPQMVRPRWENLNGLWQYAIRPAADAQPTEWDGEILVPFAVESALSGVQRPVQPSERLWYRRTFESPAKEGERLLVHFGAVDWHATVWVNGQQVGEHRGGFVPFSFDVTEALRTDGKPNELVVAAADPTDTGTQPRGKQVLKPHGIFYTAVTGIWQTVWMEPVPARHIKSLKITPQIDDGTVTVAVRSSSPGAARVRVLRDAKSIAAAVTGDKAGEDAVTLTVPTDRLWSPDNPYLYGLRVELLDGDKVVDAVNGYFAMRKIEIKKDAQGVNRLWLNNEVVFQYGPLDQGWWPDGLYTAPTDKALRYDIELTKRLGFNMARKHVKVEPSRWYYWCDKLGLLVWQDMPSGDVEKSAESKAGYRAELQEMIDALYNHPSIVMWVPFNEGWGQHETEEVAAWTKEYDPTRPVNEASGWHDKGSGDVSDMHNYPGPGMRAPEATRVSVLGEFGGLGMPVKGHTWQDEKNWGYVSYDDATKLTDAYVELLTAMRPLIGRGLSAAVYTQTTDVEIEVNGLATYDREIIKMDEPRIVAAAAELYKAPPRVRDIAATSEQAAQSWRYTTQSPADTWTAPDFDDSSWKSGEGGFGGENVRGAVVRTPWKGRDIWLRRSFNLDEAPAEGQIMLNIHHDEDADVYLNGVLIKSLTGFTKGYRTEPLEEKVRELLRPGQNTLAVHCRQTVGGQYIDAGLVWMSEP